MAAKRLFDESTNDSDPPEEKRMRTTPLLADVIKEALMRKSFQSFCANLEPLLRRVVQEEVERGVTRVARTILSRSPSTKVPALGESSLQLIFNKKLSLPLFTGSKIEDEENNPLQILLVDTSGGRTVHMTTQSLPIKVELVVLDGDFPPGDSEEWTQEEFEKNIVRERAGRRPLLAGDVSVTIRDGVGTVGEIEFTDNSSWIRSRNFRIGARVVQESSQGRRIKEAKTEAFSVRDHRGELYRKHYPPALDDDVWRLERIGKDGAFHKKLTSAGIKKVQDFLKLYMIDAVQLRRILGGGMSDKMWEGTIKHALTCDMGSKLYLLRSPQLTVVLNPICQVVGVVSFGQRCPLNDLSPMHKAYIHHLAGDAYKKWSTLEEIDALQGDAALLQYDENGAMGSYHDIIPSNVHQMHLNTGLDEMPEDEFSGFNEWMQQPNCLNGNMGLPDAYNNSDLSSDDDSAGGTYFKGGRNRKLQGLSAAILKLWEKSIIVKIAVKWGIPNTDNAQMAWELKRLTGGVLLLRNKFFIIFYRGKDFLPHGVANTIAERESELEVQQVVEEDARLKAAASFSFFEQTSPCNNTSGTFSEFHDIEAKCMQTMDENWETKVQMEAEKDRLENQLRKQERKLFILKVKIEKSEKRLAKLNSKQSPADPASDQEILTVEERQIFRNIGRKMDETLLLGRRGLFHGIIESMHQHWKHREVVKVVTMQKAVSKIMSTAALLEIESGGILVCVEKLRKGHAIIIYRGKNYKRPSEKLPQNLLDKKEALLQSIEMQRRGCLKYFANQRQQTIWELQHKLVRFPSLSMQAMSYTLATCISWMNGFACHALCSPRTEYMDCQDC